jgi:hypothetical protein
MYFFTTTGIMIHRDIVIFRIVGVMLPPATSIGKNREELVDGGCTIIVSGACTLTLE